MLRARCLLPLVCCSIAIAQATHFVGAGGFATIDVALAAAAPGDIVIVGPGAWPGFTATRAVTIRAATPGTAMIGGSCSVNGGAGVVHLVDLDLAFLSLTNATCVVDRSRVVGSSGTIGHCVSATGSTLRLVDSVIGSHGTPPSIAAFGVSVGLWTSASVLTAVDTTIIGRDRDSYGWSAMVGGGSGVVLTNGSTLHASRVVIEGGDGWSTTSYPPGSAVTASNSTFWIADSSLRCGHALGAGGTALGCPVVGTSGRLTRCTYAPTTCPPSVPTAGPLVGAHRVAPLQSGAAFQIDFKVEPNEFVGVFASLQTSHGTIPVLEQPVGLGLGSLFVLDLLLADGLGNASGTWLLPAATSNQSLWLQGLTTAAVPMQVSPPVGGIIR